MQDSTTSTEHTPGPWRAVETGRAPHGDWQIVTDEHEPRYVADISPVVLLGDAERHAADARLIAVAPDLLAAAVEAFEWAHFHGDNCNGVSHYEEGSIFDDREGCDCYLGHLRAAIAKARGEAVHP